MNEFLRKGMAEELFDRVKTGDQRALEHLFSIYFHRLNDFARKITKQEEISQDIVQDVFIKIWEIKHKIESKNIEALLFRMVRNKCIDYIKYIKLINTRLQEYEISTKYEELYRIDFIGDEPYLLIEKELKSEIDNIIKKLPEQCRKVFLLSRIDGFKNKEIAEKLNISIKNVERHLSRALSAFRKKFSDKLPISLIILVIKNLS